MAAPRIAGAELTELPKLRVAGSIPSSALTATGAALAVTSALALQSLPQSLKAAGSIALRPSRAASFCWSRQSRNEGEECLAQKRRAPSNVAAAEDGARAGAGEVAPAAAKALLDRITQEATARIRRRLSLAERARLPYGIKHLIDVAAMHVVEGAVEVAVTREVRGAAVRLARTSVRPDDASTPSDFALLKEGLSLRSSELSSHFWKKPRISQPRRLRSKP